MATTPEDLSDAQIAAAINRAKWLDPTTGELIDIPNPLQPGTGCVDTSGIEDAVEP